MYDTNRAWPSGAPTTTIVIFGASGDLTRRKLIPSLYYLHRKGRLPAVVTVVGEDQERLTLGIKAM